MTPVRPPRTARRVAASIVVALLVAAVAGACSGDDRAEVQVVADPKASVDHDYVIPFGTNNRIVGGEDVTIVPQVLNVKVGDRIRIENQDDYGAQVGIFNVGAGETVTMEFTTPGRLEGACDVHPSGTFTINVRDA